MVPQKPFPMVRTCQSLTQNSVSPVRISRFWKHLPTKTLLSHHLLVKPPRVDFRVGQSKHQKVSSSQILLLRKSSSWIQMQVREGIADCSRDCCLPFLVSSTQCRYLHHFNSEWQTATMRAATCFIFTIFQTLRILHEYTYNNSEVGTITITIYRWGN